MVARRPQPIRPVESLTKLDRIMVVLGLALGIYSVAFFFATSREFVAFWLDRNAYGKTEFTVQEVVRESSFGDSIEIYLVGEVQKTGGKLKHQDWLTVDPRVDRSPDDAQWRYLTDREKIGVRFPIWYANERRRIYYVSTYPSKPSDLQAATYILFQVGISLAAIFPSFRSCERQDVSLFRKGICLTNRPDQGLISTIPGYMR